MIFENTTNLPTHLFSAFHICYMIVIITLMVVGVIHLKKHIHGEQNEKRVIRILGGILLVLILANRYACTTYDIMVGDATSMINLIPHSFCGLSSLVVAICCLFIKKDSKILESMLVFAIFGGISNIFYPNYLDKQYLYDLRTWTGLLHHALSAFILIYLVAIEYVKPTLKRWYLFPISALLTLALGFFEIYVLHIKNCMNIDEPLVSSIPSLTNGYMLCVWFTICDVVFLVLFEILHNKKTFKTLLT